MATSPPTARIKSVLIIDDDELVRNLIRNYVKMLGIERIDVAVCGEEGWRALEGHVYDFIVLDWKLPRLGGMALLNRIRSKESYRLTPVLVVSGYVERFDFRLLQEFPATSLIEKPFTKALFEKSMSKLIAEQEWYEKNEKNIMALLRAVRYEEKKTFGLVKDMIKKAPNPVPLAMMAGCHLSTAGELRTAEKIFEAILEHDADCVVAMNELAKVFHAKGQHKKALDLLHNANHISPQNVQRLCLLGEVELNLKDPESARSYFAKALEIDPQDRIAASGIVISENMAEMMASPEMDRIPKSFASMLNSMGIAFVRSGNFHRGIEQYHSAFAFLRSDFDNARLAFNLGLGYMRWGKPDKALPWFERSANLGSARFTKSRNFVRRLKTSERPSELLSASGSAEGELQHADEIRYKDAEAGGAPLLGTAEIDSHAIDTSIPGLQSSDGFFEEEDDEGEESISL